MKYSVIGALILIVVVGVYFFATGGEQAGPSIDRGVEQNADLISKQLVVEDGVVNSADNCVNQNEKRQRECEENKFIQADKERQMLAEKREKALRETERKQQEYKDCLKEGESIKEFRESELQRQLSLSANAEGVRDDLRQQIESQYPLPECGANSAY